jgi:sugar phosphate isomerase/epimerase
MRAINVKAKKTMDILTANCPNLCDHDRFKTEPFMDVVVKNIDDCNLGAMFSIAHYYEQNGDLIRDLRCASLRVEMANTTLITTGRTD